MRFLAVLLTMMIASTAGVAAAQGWAVYESPSYGYSVEYPTAGFTITESGKGLALSTPDGRGQIDIYGAVNEGRLSPARFETVVKGAENIRKVTYRRRGRSWLAISGYYRADAGSSAGLIFYAKFMFSPDRRLLSAFEASYPASDKARYDVIIERMEDTLTAPHAVAAEAQ